MFLQCHIVQRVKEGCVCVEILFDNELQSLRVFFVLSTTLLLRINDRSLNTPFYFASFQLRRYLFRFILLLFLRCAPDLFACILNPSSYPS